MAEIFTRTYTYAGQSDWAAGASAVPLSSFAVSGDTRPITQILSVEVSYYRYHDTSSTVIHAAELALPSGAVLASNQVSQRGDGGVFRIDASFPDPPAAAAWQESGLTLRTTISTKQTHVYWRATAAQPMVVTLTYTSSAFKPSISAAKLYRANELGAASDSGTRLTFSATLSVEKIGTNGSGTLTIYSGDSPSTAATQVYQQSGIAGSTAGATLSKAPIPGCTLPQGEKRWYRVEFAYTASTGAGAQVTETASVALPVNSVFTNVHLSGASTGGVRFGGYSTAAEDSPKFECDYPAYLYGGIAQIGDGTENPLFAVPGEAITYGSSAILWGYVTSSRTSIHLIAPVGKLLTNVSAVSVTAITGHMRNEGGYGLTSAVASGGSNYAGLVASATIDRPSNSVHIAISRSSAFYLTNNAAVTFVPEALTLLFA